MRAGLGFALVLGVFGLFLAWRASAQQPAAESPVLQYGYAPNYPLDQHAARDPERDKLLKGEAAAAQEVQRLVKDYGRTEDDKERTKIKEKLATALSKQFDLQQKRRDLELSRLEAKLKKLRAVLMKRDEERKTIIDKRLDQLVREADGLGWAPPPGPRGSASSAQPYGGLQKR
jgi:hypothetical protein